MLKNKPLVSVLIPVYNRQGLIIETLESIVNQTYFNIEIIIVDNCSTDDTWDIVNKYSLKDERIKIFQNKENVGPVLNWKRCIDEAKGEFSKVLFSDDLLKEDYIEKTLLNFDEETAFVLSEIQIFNQSGVKRKINYYNKGQFTTTKYLNDILLFNWYKFPVSPSCAIFRTKDLRKALLIDIPNPLELNFKRYGAGNDLLIFLNIAKDYKKIKTALNTTAYFRSHKDSLTISNKLVNYYDFSKFYFIKTNKFKLLKKFKLILLLKSFYRKEKSNVLSVI